VNALFNASLLHLNVAARMSLHARTCSSMYPAMCPPSLEDFLDANDDELCEIGQALRREMEAAEREIVNAVQGREERVS
jgi:hypothetical protein